MPEEIELTPPSHSAPDNPAPTLERLSAAALAQLVLGFYFLFWGLLALVAALTESLVVVNLRPLSVILLGAGGLAMGSGAWRLHRVRGLGDLWRRRTRNLLLVTVGVAYLSLFYIMWRQIPTNLYLLVNALIFFAFVLVTLGLLCLPVITLARAAGRPSLAGQASTFGTMTVVLLVPPFGLIAERLLEAVHHGIDPFALLQFWVEHTALWTILVLLVPFSLTLSLLWSAKDLVLDQLNTRAASLTPPEN